MKFAEPTKFHRKSGMWGTRPWSGNPGTGTAVLTDSLGRPQLLQSKKEVIASTQLLELRSKCIRGKCFCCRL